MYSKTYILLYDHEVIFEHIYTNINIYMYVMNTQKQTT